LDFVLYPQGGNYVDLHQMMGVRSGTEVLYVGDHIYGDILRSKKVRCSFRKHATWCGCLVMHRRVAGIS